MARIQETSSSYGSPLGNPAFQRWADLLIGRGGCAAFTGTGTCSPTNPGNTNGTAGSSITGGVGGTISTGTTIPYDWRITDLDAFLQDDFKVNSRLTLNLGDRREYAGWAKGKGGYFTNSRQSLRIPAANPGSRAICNG